MNAKFTDLYATADYIGPGAIEVPLGLRGKNEAEWRRFQHETHEQGLESRAPDAQAIRALVEWLTT